MSARLNGLSILRHLILRAEMCRFQETNQSVVSQHWSTPLHRSQCLLGKVVGIPVKNAARSTWEEGKSREICSG